MAQNLEQMITQIMRKIPVVTRQQLITYLLIQTSASQSVIMDAISACAHNGSILISTNSRVTTREAYDVVRTVDLPYKFGLICRLRGRLAITAEAEDFLDCFWIILGLLPASEDFILTSYTPLRMLFLDAGKNRFVQIARIRRGNELTCISYLRSLPAPLPEEQFSMRRIALVDDREVVDLLGEFGFTDFCLLDEDEPSHIRVLKDKELRIHG